MSENHEVRVTVLGVILWTFAWFTYFHLAPQMKMIRPVIAQVTRWDDMIPFWPWTMAVYLSLYFQVIACIWMVDKQHRFVPRFMFVMLVLLTLVLTSIFCAKPEIIMRPEVPSSIFSNLILWVRQSDEGLCTYPSGHIAYSLFGPIFLLAYGDERKVKQSWFVFVWGVLISASTLTTKQHVVTDVVATVPLIALFAIVCGLYAREWARRLSLPGIKSRELGFTRWFF